MAERKIFRSLSSLEEARAKLNEHFTPKLIGFEETPLENVYGRILAEDILSTIDVPGFDRALMDGYAVRAQDTFGAEEDQPKRLRVVGRVEAGDKPSVEVKLGEAVEVGTGAPMPKGANAVVMVEYTQREGLEVTVWKAVAPGGNVMAAGSDIMMGENILRAGKRVTPVELGVLAALGIGKVKVLRKPRVAILSTGNELLPPGATLDYGKVYDINSSALSGAVSESGGEPFLLGVARDDPDEIRSRIGEALRDADVVITSGSTSAGFGDLIYKVVDSLGKPGILVHGIAVKPGKPTLLAVLNGKPLFGLPGYPTSALIIFNLLVRPLLLSMAGLAEERRDTRVKAKTAVRIFTSKGRREFLPVCVVQDEAGNLRVYPMLSGSGAITSLAIADGFIEVPETREFLEEGEDVHVNLFSSGLKPPDLMIIGSHCVGVDVILAYMRKTNSRLQAKVVNVGSTGGLHAIQRGHADIAGIHLLDEASGEYNKPFLRRYNLLESVLLVRGYNRIQGLITTAENTKRIRGFEDLLRSDVTFINRNRGSGTRIITDLNLQKLAAAKGIRFEEFTAGIKGYDVEAKSHSAVAASVLHEKADVGVGIKAVADMYGLSFIPITEEHYDFIVLKRSLEKEAVKAFLSTLRSNGFRAELEKRAPGLVPTEETGSIFL